MLYSSEGRDTSGRGGAKWKYRLCSRYAGLNSPSEVVLISPRKAKYSIHTVTIASLRPRSAVALFPRLIMTLELDAKK